MFQRLALACGAGLCVAATGCAGWSAQPMPNPPAPTGNSLSSVSCADPDNCLAVGSSDPNGIPFPVAERWEGGAWSVLPPIALPEATSGELNDVSCSAPDVCTAVGSYRAATTGALTGFAARWDGGTWALQSIAAPAESVGTNLQGVSCPTDTSCVAVGVYYRRAGRFDLPVTLAEHWDGRAWTIEPTPSPAPSEILLRRVSCARPDACTAVGRFYDNGREVGLAERWDGSSWELQTVPEAPNAVATRLEAVSCATRVVCTAVGTTQTDVTFETLVQRWSEGAWTVQPSPTPSGLPSQLLAVSCPTRKLCSAVGTRLITPTGNDTMLAERWSRSTWTIEATFPPSGAVYGRLRGVSCPTRTACTAVGYWGVQPGILRPLAMARLVIDSSPPSPTAAQ